MHNRQLLIGIVVSITEPELRSSRKGTKRHRVVCTLDVSNGTESRVDTIPIEFWGRKALNIRRDIVTGDMITVVGIVTDETDGTLLTTRMIGWEYLRHATANEGYVLGRVCEVGKLLPVQLRCGDRWRQKYKLTFMLVVYVHHKYKYYLRLHILGKDWAKQWKKRLRKGQLVSVTYKLASYRIRGGETELMPVVRHIEVCEIPLLTNKLVTPKTVFMTRSLKTWNDRVQIRAKHEEERLEREKRDAELLRERMAYWEMRQRGEWAGPGVDVDPALGLDDGESGEALLEEAGEDLLAVSDYDSMEEGGSDDE